MQQVDSSNGMYQQGRTLPLGSGNIAKRTKGDGQEMPVTNDELADKFRPWQSSPAKPAQRVVGSTPMGSVQSSGVDADVSAQSKNKDAERASYQIPSNAAPANQSVCGHHHAAGRRRVNSLPLRSLNSPPSADPLSPAYERGIDGANLVQNAGGYAPYKSSNPVEAVNGHQVNDALLHKIQSSASRRRGSRQQYTPSFASRSPGVDGGTSSSPSSRTSSMSDLSTSYPADTITYQASPRHFPAHPASVGYQSGGGGHHQQQQQQQQHQQQQQQHSQSQPSSGHHTPSRPATTTNGYMSPPMIRPVHGAHSPHSGASPQRPRADHRAQHHHHQQQQQQQHIAPANIHAPIHPAAVSQSECLYATTTALLRATNPGSRTGVVMTDGGSSSAAMSPTDAGAFLATSPTTGGAHKERQLNRENLLQRNSSSDSLNNDRHLMRGTSSDSIDRSMERLPSDAFLSSPTGGGGPDALMTSPMMMMMQQQHTTSNGSIDSSSSSGIGHSTSPSIERGVRLGGSSNMATIAETSAARAISRSSSGSSLSASSSNSLDASNGGSQKRVVFGASSDRKKIKVNKEPPTVHEAKQAAIRTLAIGQVMEAAGAGNLAHLHRLHASTLPTEEQMAFMRDANGASPLHKAAENGHVAVVNFLLVGCGLSEDSRRKATEIADRDYLTPCMLAVQNGHLDCVKVLVEASQGDFETDDHGSTLLHLAAAFDQVDCLEFILDAMKQRGVDPHVATDTGVTPAHVAAQKGSINCLRVLFDAGTQIQTDDEDLTPTDWARKAGHGLCEHYLTVIQTCWELHASLEDAETKLTRTNQKNKTLETQLSEAQKQQVAVESEIQKIKEDCDRRLKETKEDFAQLMTRMMQQVGGGKTALEEKMKSLNVSTIFPNSSPPSTGKKVKSSSSPPVPPRTVTLPNSTGSSPASSKHRRSRSESLDSVRRRLQLNNALDDGDMDEVMSIVEREHQLDSLNMSNIGISDVEDEDGLMSP